ncbi:MAG: flagellar filament capping protein FliD [Firmicutes bacterium]|nr:flagellar filament capping protein FliD [Bacillota bacterium]
MSGLYISGLASGIDTDALVSEIMQIEGQAVKRLEGQKQQLLQKADAWRDVRTRLVSLQQAARELARGSLYDQKSATASDQSRVAVTAGKNAINGDYQLEILSLARAHSVKSYAAAGVVAGADSRTALGLVGDLTINGASIEIGAGDSLLDISQKINAGEGAGVKAVVIDERLVLTGSRTGSEERITIGGNLAERLGLLAEGATIQEAADAVFRLNGLEIIRSGNLVDNVLEGVTFNLLQETDGPVTITVQDDYSEINAKVEGFVQQYNSTYQFIKSKMSVDPAAGKKGDLYGESSLNQVLSSIRRIVTGLVGEENRSLFSIGITTTAWNSGQPEGTLTLDRDKFIAALEADPKMVENLLGGVDGAASRLEEYIGGLTRYGEGLFDSRNKGIESRIQDLDRRVINMQRRLEQREKTIRAQFLAVERLIGQMNGQSQWLEQQINALANLQPGGYRRG